jgi:hypothetical protein
VAGGAWERLKAAGVISGMPGYGLLLTTVDGQLTGGGVDKLLIKIGDAAARAMVYDNGLGWLCFSDLSAVGWLITVAPQKIITFITFAKAGVSREAGACSLARITAGAIFYRLMLPD